MTKRTLVHLYVSLALVFIPSTWNSAEGTGCSHKPARGEYNLPPTPSPPPGRVFIINKKIVHVQIICLTDNSIQYMYAACITSH